MNIIFFGSFQHYSTIILESLYAHPEINIIGVVTTPPMPAGRKQLLTPTHTHAWAVKNDILVFVPEKLDHDSLENLKSKIHNLDFFVVAGFGKILPPEWLTYPQYGSLNIHFSLLPKYRGANPAEWAILLGETKTGISLITMNPKIDAGDIITKHSTKITPTDTRESVYQKLYTLSARHSPDDILKYSHWLQKKDATCQTALAPRPQEKPIPPYARLLKRDDGFIPWQIIQKAINGENLTPSDFNTKLFTSVISYTIDSDVSKHRNSEVVISQSLLQLLNRSCRALYGYPGLWSIVPTTKGDKRLKIHTISIYQNKLLLETVQLEGQDISSFNQIKNQLIM
jgi:methionyl-tRNA formyltransferase